MTLNATDPIRGPARGDATTAIAALDGPDAKDQEFVNALFQLAPTVGLDFSVCVSQVYEETGGLTSTRWNTDLNPAGISISSSDTVQPFPIQSATEAAKIYLACLNRLTAGTVTEPWYGDINAQARQWIESVWHNHCQAATAAKVTVKTINDLCIHYTDASGTPESTWAWDPQYAANIVQWGNKVFPALPDAGGTPVTTTTAAPSAPPTDDTQDISKLNMTRGLIPMPAFVDDIIDVSQRSTSLDCRGYDYLGARSNPPEFLVLHRSQDPPGQSNSGYFHETCCPALTDFEVLATTGQGRRFVDIAHSNVAGWANGVVSSPYGDALKYLNETGWDLNRVNRNGEACEITGWFAQPGSSITADSPVSDAAWAWLAQWIASRAHDYGIPWFQFPIIPKENSRSYVTWHQEWTIGTGKVCPGQVVMDYTPTLFQRAAAIMKTAQTAHLTTTTTTTTPAPKGAPSGPYAAAVPVPGPVQDQLYHGTPMFAFVHQMETVRDGVKCLAAGSPHAAETRAPLAKGTKINTAYLYRSATDGNAYVIGAGGSRVLLSDLAPVLAPDNAPAAVGATTTAAATSGK